MAKNILTKRDKIKRKIRSRVSGTEMRPRFSIFRSNNFMYAQLIDDANGVTLLATSDKKETGKKMDGAAFVGKTIAELAKAKGIATVVFDRNGFKYAGRVKKVADAAREAGLQF